MQKIIAITPSTIVDSTIAVAACRAGQTGILDLGYKPDKSAILTALTKLKHYAGRTHDWGIRWDTLDDESRSPSLLAEFLGEPVQTIILSATANIGELLREVRPLAQQVLLEVCSLDAAKAAQDAGYDGIIVKGNESGGHVSRETSFILCQRLRNNITIPYWIQGGIGTYTAAAARLAGAKGVVVCEQLWLTDESPFSAADRATWQSLEGSETLCLGHNQPLYRCYTRLGRAEVNEASKRIKSDSELKALLRIKLLSPQVQDFTPCGQDIGLASHFARRYGTVGRVLHAMNENISEQIRIASEKHPLSANSPLADLHRTHYPIVQGPMARVSDVVPFSKAVASAGGLPFLGLSLMRGPDIDELLSEAQNEMGASPWGVGVLGFIDRALREEQIEAIKKFRPPFAIIAGGRPNQAAELEKFGTLAYLHVPSPTLLTSFIKAGARKFIFEGHECGGHVGPLSSFVLWETIIHCLHQNEIRDPENLWILFAGGIHDALSAAMVEVIAAPLLKDDIKVGILMGTAYLFTDEAVQHKAITRQYQKQAVACSGTVLLHSGAGHASRCIQTPFVDRFYDAKQDLVHSGKSNEEIVRTLELMNIGRLRIAAKGVSKCLKEDAAIDDVRRLVELDEETQRSEGLFMVGQVAEICNRTFSIKDLHAEVCNESLEYLQELDKSLRQSKVIEPKGVDIAIVGMACIFPDAPDMQTYWKNIVNGKCSVREVSPDRWMPEDFFEPNRLALEKTYSKWGCFLNPVFLDPAKYGIPPRSLESIGPIQLLALETAQKALEDAGYLGREYPRERTTVIFGAGGFADDISVEYAFRSILAQQLNRVLDASQETRQIILESLQQRLPKWTKDTFPGTLPNIVSGRIANRLNLGGTNFIVEAACASSFAALEVIIRQLQARACDVGLVGAVDTANHPLSYIMFSRTQALSPTGRSCPLDDSADGIVLGEGVAAMVLKRLADAERDGDRIYAVIKGIGSSSDGRNRSLVAPHVGGQVLALHRAYESAEVDPKSVELMELHGTGTVLGDKTEIESLIQLIKSENDNAQSHFCAIGSVKSNIGHAKVAAGMAGMIKAILSLQHKLLPPTIGVTTPNSRVNLNDSPFYINTEARPWIRSKSNGPRRVGMSAFGFGGTNFHAIMEEYNGEYRDHFGMNFVPREAEIFTFAGSERSALEAQMNCLLEELSKIEKLEISQLAYSLFVEEQQLHSRDGNQHCKLCVVATSLDDLKKKLSLAAKGLADNGAIRNPLGVYYAEGDAASGSVCFLFPGQGSQKINMLRDILLLMPQLQDGIEMADEVLEGFFDRPISRFIYPNPAFTEQQRQHQQSELNQTQVAQPAMGLIDLLAFDVLQSFGLQPDVLAGHSLGEYVALCAGGSISRRDLMRLLGTRGRIVRDHCSTKPGAMAAIQANVETVSTLLVKSDSAAAIANCNAPDQTVIGGPVEEIGKMIKEFESRGFRARQIPVTSCFHTPEALGMSRCLAAELEAFEFRTPKIKISSNTTSHAYPESSEEIRKLLARHICEPVLFEKQIRQIYSDGATIFLEVGPGRVLTGLVDKILSGETYHALCLDVAGRSTSVQLLHTLAQAKSIGLPVDLSPWFEGRKLDTIHSEALLKNAQAPDNIGPQTWQFSGGRLTPLNQTDKPSSSAQPVFNHHVPRAAVAKVDHSQPQQNVVSSLEQKEHYPMSSRNKELADLVIGQSSYDRENYTSALNKIEENMTEFFDLQREQQKTAQQFIDLQEKMLQALYGRGTSPDSTTPGLPFNYKIEKNDAPSPQSGQAVFVTQAVPPTPMLPELLDGPLGSTKSIPQQALDSQEVKDVNQVETIPPGQIPSVQEFNQVLIQIISENTGFPVEMLDPHLNMEADLGVDSIKKIEVFSLLREKYDFMRDQDEEKLIEELAGLTTIDAIVKWYDLQLSTYAGNTAPVTAIQEKPMEDAIPEQTGGDRFLTQKASPDTAAIDLEGIDTPDLTPEPVQRWLPKPVQAGNYTDSKAASLPSQASVLVMGEMPEIRTLFEKFMPDLPNRIVYVSPGERTKALGDHHYEADFSSLQSIQELRALISESTTMVGAIINLNGLTRAFQNRKLIALKVSGIKESVKGFFREPSMDKYDGWDEAKHLFMLLKVFEEDLKQSAEVGSPWFVNLSFMDGNFGLKGGNHFPIGQAGTVGLTKAIAKELPHLRVKTIDVDPKSDPFGLIEGIRRELTNFDDLVEVGLTGQGRWKIELIENAEDPTIKLDLALDSDSVILVTGGAYGIAAEIIKEIAAKYKPRIFLVGRTKLPEEETADIANIHTEKELRAFLIRKMSEEVASVTPATIEKRLKEILKNRRIRENLNQLKMMTENIEYYSMDIRDSQSFKNLIEDIYRKWGRIDGVIHAAGIIEDQQLKNKSPESFARVFETKVKPAMVLAKHLRPEQLKFLVFFSSVAARFGNAGQTDYCAANEFLNKLAIQLNTEWDARVLSINWGPWNYGMISESLRNLFSSRGVGLISVAEGVDMFLGELERPADHCCEVLIARTLEKISANI